MVGLCFFAWWAVLCAGGWGVCFRNEGACLDKGGEQLQRLLLARRKRK